MVIGPCRAQYTKEQWSLLSDPFNQPSLLRNLCADADLGQQFDGLSSVLSALKDGLEPTRTAVQARWNALDSLKKDLDDISQDVLTNPTYGEFPDILGLLRRPPRLSFSIQL